MTDEKVKEAVEWLEGALADPAPLWREDTLVPELGNVSFGHLRAILSDRIALAEEVERLTERYNMFCDESRHWNKEYHVQKRRVEASEAKLTALVEAAQRFADLIDSADRWGECGWRDELKALRQALAHHSAPVGSREAPRSKQPGVDVSDPAALAEAAERIRASTPTSAPVEDVGTYDGARWVFWNPDTGQEIAKDHPVESGEVPDAMSIRRSTSLEDALADQLSALIQPQGEERS